MVARLRAALDEGRPRDGETHEIAGFRQVEAVMGICAEAQEVEL
jgi:hypothetical protein